MFHLFKRKILTLKNNREKQQQLQKKKEQDNVGVHGFIVFSKTIITLKLKPQMKLCSCPLESIYCLKKCPGAHSTLDKCLQQGPFNKPQFLQNMLDDFSIITTSPCLPTNAVFNTNIPFCLLFFKTVITLKLKLQIKLRSCPLESIYRLKKCPGVHSTLDKCYYSVLSTKHNFSRIC